MEFIQDHYSWVGRTCQMEGCKYMEDPSDVWLGQTIAALGSFVGHTENDYCPVFSDWEV